MGLWGSLAVAGGSAIASKVFPGSKPKASTGKVDVWSPWQKELGKKLGTHLKGQPLGVPTEAPESLSALEEWAMGKYREAGPEAAEEYYETSVQEPMLEAFQEKILPGISRGYAPSGFWGSERLGAEEQAREDLLTALTRSRADLMYRERESMVPGAALETATRTALQERGMPTEEERRVQMLLAALGLKGAEPYAVGTPGQGGFLQSLLGGFAGSYGSGLGSLLAKGK